MLKALKWVGIVVGGLVGLLVIALVVVYFTVGARLNKTYAIQVEQIPVPTDPAAAERGQQLVNFVRCVECHGQDMGGRVFLEAPGVGRLVASNLTTGKGGVGGAFQNTDWVRALRHGVGPDGKSLLVTPAQFYYSLSDADVGAIIAYLQTVPPVDRELPESTLGPLGRLFLQLFNPPEWLPAEKIDHNPPRPPEPVPGVTAAYGKYLVQTTACAACHGSAGAPPLEMEAVGWSKDQFVKFMRTGVDPEGNIMSNDFMPWENTRAMSEEDLEAMWLYIHSLEARRGP